MKQTLADQVDHTCQELTRRQMPITFAAVAESLGISRSTLYRNPGLRALVDASRQRDRASELTVSGVAVQVDPLDARAVRQMEMRDRIARPLARALVQQVARAEPFQHRTGGLA